MALKIVHYALIALAIAICIVYLYWRWRKVNNQNKALEAELRLVQPYNNMPAPEVVQMRPTLQFQPVDLAAVTKANIDTAVVPSVTTLNKSPPVLTPTASTIDEESDEDEEENVGSPPMVPEVILTPATITVVAISNNRDPVVADSNFTPDATPGITELTDITATSEDEAAQESIIEDKPAPSKTTRRRRK